MLDEKIHATRRERNLVRLTIDPAEGMVLCGAVKRTVGIVRDKVARGRRCDVVDDLFFHRGNTNQPLCPQQVSLFSSMVCTDHIDHDPHVLSFGLADQVLQIGFASERFIQRVDVLKKGSTISPSISAVRETLTWIRSILLDDGDRATHLGPVTVVRFAKRCVPSDILAKWANSVLLSAPGAERDPESRKKGVGHSPRRWARSRSTMTEKRFEGQSRLSSVSTRKVGGGLVQRLTTSKPMPLM
jgi:hypothetical protein